MWRKVFSKIYHDIELLDIWAVWADINRWPDWDQELESCQLEGEFVAGGHFTLRPKGGPNIKLHLDEVIAGQKFTDSCRFFGAVMHDVHELKQESEGVRITNTIIMTGPLAWLWVLLVANDIVKSLPKQTDALVAFVRQQYV